MNLNLIAIAAAGFVAVLAYQSIESKGVQKERASVQVKAKANDAKAQDIRKRVAANPDPVGLLTKFWRD